MNIQLSISTTYLDAEEKLSKRVRKKARDFFHKFMANPTAPGLNFERIKGSKHLRSVRVDKGYRAIVLHPEKGDVFIVLWIDNHDAAYAWADRHKCTVNPVTGSLQLYPVELMEPLPPAEAPIAPEHVVVDPDHSAAELFGEFDDDILVGLGIPESLLPAVRFLRSEAQLDALALHLPVDAREALYWLAAGYSPEQTLEELCRPKPGGEVDVEDFATALQHPVSRASFAEVRDAEELEQVLNAPLSQWRLFLHPSQEQLVTWNPNGAVRVLGGAGTGKTVVLMHRAQRLVKEVFPEGKILVTTFTRNLALSLSESLKSLCGNDFSRIDVQNIHTWAQRFLSRNGKSVRIATTKQKEELFRRAVKEKGQVDLPLSFYREEWERVVQDQGITDRATYVRTPRTGRGTALKRTERASIWGVFERYRTLLNLERLMEWEDLVKEAREILENRDGKPLYDAVLVDEIQDFSTSDLLLLRALVPEGPSDLFMVGDNFQRIYPRTTSLLQCGIEIRGRARHLKVNYRTTQQIRAWAVSVLQGRGLKELDEGADTLKGYHSLRQGDPPIIEHFDGKDEELGYIVQLLKDWLAEGLPAEHICVTARTTNLVSCYLETLQAAGLPTCQLTGDGPVDGNGIRLATMHRMKGLEFPRVLIAGISRDTLPLHIGKEFPDEASRMDFEQGERCLLYVAATRARDRLVVSGWGDRSPFVPQGTSGGGGVQ